MQEAARVQLARPGNQFELCERGRSYLLYDVNDSTLQLVDLATGKLKRALTPRA